MCFLRSRPRRFLPYRFPLFGLFVVVPSPSLRVFASSSSSVFAPRCSFVFFFGFVLAVTFGVTSSSGTGAWYPTAPASIREMSPHSVTVTAPTRRFRRTTFSPSSLGSKVSSISRV